ncbi:hypothetical protein Ctha_2268 [Chloroherpeton thalassium ATCC 35110]|uniref:Uncharacterized protein n=2 Tax=Chloroherpeton thalassium TaxID=100716 RepID=B3QWF9_CHLT3|nr:hypothetical protein Ctha_2268 [Chloroherpeton thalassium ATCC 35110]
MLFFNRIVKPIFLAEYDAVEVRQYAQMKTEKLQRLIQGLLQIGADVLVACDIDFHPCVTSKKHYIKHRFRLVSDARIVVVIQEIESWYLAGLTNYSSEKLKVRRFPSTDQITKEAFAELKPKNCSRISFMLSILKRYSMRTAIKKNRSFAYFFHKHLEPAIFLSREKIIRH